MEKGALKISRSIYAIRACLLCLVKMASSIGMWISAGIFYLIYLTYQDYTNNMLVDDRKNYFMGGFTFSILVEYHKPLLYVLATIIVMLILRHVFLKRGILGEADVNSMVWIFMGFAYVGPLALVSAGFIFASVWALDFFIHFIFKGKEYNKPRPFYFTILLSFALAGLQLIYY